VRAREPASPPLHRVARDVPIAVSAECANLVNARAGHSKNHIFAGELSTAVRRQIKRTTDPDEDISAAVRVSLLSDSPGYIMRWSLANPHPDLSGANAERQADSSKRSVMSTPTKRTRTDESLTDTKSTPKQMKSERRMPDFSVHGGLPTWTPQGERTIKHAYPVMMSEHAC
jgi:hypothetical protein